MAHSRALERGCERTVAAQALSALVIVECGGDAEKGLISSAPGDVGAVGQEGFKVEVTWRETEK